MSRSRLRRRAPWRIVAPMTEPVYIHAGAHRTGTSSFQLCLHENRAALAAQGYDLAYPGRDGVPGGRLRMRLPRPRHGLHRVGQYAGALRAHLAGFRGGPGRALIVSEENISGPMRHFYEGRFFPASGKRLRVLAAALDGPPEHLLYVLRPYAEIFASAYRKRAEDNPVPPFAEIVPRLIQMDRGWPELLAEMRDLLRPRRMTVLRYENRGSSRALLARLVPGLSAQALREPQKAVNLSATDAALQALQARYRAGEVLTRPVWKRIVETHADDRSEQGFAAYGRAERRALEARYAADLERVAALAKITFL